MPRVKRGVTAHRRHKKVLAMTKGQRATRHSLFRRAHEALLKSLSYAYSHRRERKGDMRRLWILRVNAATRAQGLSYSQFMNGLKKAGVLGIFTPGVSTDEIVEWVRQNVHSRQLDSR